MKKRHYKHRKQEDGEKEHDKKVEELDNLLKNEKNPNNIMFLRSKINIVENGLNMKDMTQEEIEETFNVDIRMINLERSNGHCCLNNSTLVPISISMMNV